MPVTKILSSARLRTFVLVLLAGIALAGMSGCRATDVLKLIVYDQSSEQVDYERDQKVYISDETSETLSDKVSADEISEDVPANNEVQNLVIYASDPNMMSFPTKDSIFSLTPSFAGFEASRGVQYYLSDSEDSLYYEITEEELEDYDEDEVTIEVGTTWGEEEAEEGVEGTGDSDARGDLNTDEGEVEGQEAEDGGSDASDADNTKVVTKNTRGKYSSTPSVSHIAAFGELAVIVQAIGGEGALVAADAELLDSSFSKVFADEGAANIAVGWTDDGTTAAHIDVDAIIAAGAETILCYDSDYYEDQMSEEDIVKLNEAGIYFTLVYPLTYTTGLKSTVTTIGNMLADAEDIGEAGNTKANASAYITFYNTLTKAALKANNNKLASADSTTYESNNTTSYTYNSSAAYTLLIDGYDADASFSHKTGSYNPTSDGALLATLGYKSRSTSYYLQLGGVINNAAANFRASADGMLMMVWQFHTGSYGFDKKYWTYSANSILASAYYPSSASGWTYTLLTIGEGTGSNSSGYSGSFPGASFGTSTFPTVITTSQAAKDALVKNSQRENGLYTPYDIVTDGSLNYFGVNTGSILLFSCIGANGIDSTVNAFADYDGINEDAVYVNPCGLFSSWTEGAGMEAVLECAWANDVINSDSDEIGYWDYVEEFYETFYRYSLTKADKTDILDGE